MENQPTSAWKYSFQYGLGIGFILIILSLVLYVMDVNTFENRWISWVSYGILFIGMLIAMLGYKNKVLGGYISFGKSFSVGFYTALIAGILSGIFMVIFMFFAGDEIEQLALENAEQEVLKRNPNASDQEIEMGIKFTKMFLNPFALGLFTIIGNAFW
jgi:cation transport ATPase